MKNKSFQNNLKSFVLLVALAGFIAACGGLPGIPVSRSIPNKELPFLDADYYLLTIVNGKLTAFKTPDNINNKWWYANEGDQDPNQIIFAQDPNCTSGTAYDVSDTLPDGRLQLWKLCRMGSTESQMKTLTYLMVYDWQTGEMEKLGGPLPLGSSQASWNPDQTRAIVYLDSGFASGTLYRIWKDGFGPLDLVITDQTRSWNLKNDFPDFKTKETGESGNTGRAIWSPDGHTIAFFASLDVIGKTGFDRFYVEYNLYLMDADQLEPKAVLDNFYFPFVIKWSPDSKYIAFIGQYGKSKQDGIWLYSVENSSIVNIDTGKFQDILWEPGKTSLFAIKCDNDSYCSQILEYDLAGVIKP